MYGARYAWLIPGWFSENWWKKHLDEESIGCTVEQMNKAVNGYISCDNLKINPDNTTSVSGQVSKLISAFFYDSCIYFTTFKPEMGWDPVRQRRGEGGRGVGCTKKCTSAAGRKDGRINKIQAIWLPLHKNLAWILFGRRLPLCPPFVAVLLRGCCHYLCFIRHVKRRKADHDSTMFNLFLVSWAAKFSVPKHH